MRDAMRSLFIKLFERIFKDRGPRNLPPYLLRDIGLDERKKPDWKRDLL